MAYIKRDNPGKNAKLNIVKQVPIVGEFFMECSSPSVLIIWEKMFTKKNSVVQRDLIYT
jgi:hypothetical protein